MNASDSRHALAPDLVLLLPATFAVRATAQGLSGSEAGTGVLLSALSRLTPSDAVDDERLQESAIALLQKKYASAERLGAPAPIVCGGRRGRLSLLRAIPATNAPIHIVVTTLIIADPENAAQQRNLIMVLEVPTAAFGQRPGFYQRFAQERLLIGAAGPLPLEQPAGPETAAKATVTAPARAPESPRAHARTPAAEPGEDELLASAARGQRILAISIVLSFVARAVGNLPDVPVLFAYAISAAVLFYAISGVLRICSGFRYSLNHRLVLMFCSSVPLVGIVCWVWLSVRTTRRLRAAGYRVGLFGVRP